MPRQPINSTACGIYAYHRPGPRTYFGESWWCEGVIAAWGTIEVHADGLRAEHASVEALGVPDLGNPQVPPAIAAVCERLGVPVMDARDLPAFAEDRGGGIPPALLP